MPYFIWVFFLWIWVFTVYHFNFVFPLHLIGYSSCCYLGNWLQLPFLYCIILMKNVIGVIWVFLAMLKFAPFDGCVCCFFSLLLVWLENSEIYELTSFSVWFYFQLRLQLKYVPNFYLIVSQSSHGTFWGNFVRTHWLLPRLCDIVDFFMPLTEHA